MNNMLSMLKWIQSLRTPVLDVLFKGITILGEEYFFIIVLTIIFWCVNKNFGYRIGFAYLSSGIVNIGLKETFQVPRPFDLDSGIVPMRIETAGGYSFPSGHTQCTATLFTSIMLNIKTKKMYVVGSVAILLVALSRLYLGVHTPVDVIGGAIIGIIWGFVINWMFNYVERTGRKFVFLLFIIPMVLGMFLFRIPDYYKVSGTVLSFYVGYIIESRYIHYQVKGYMFVQILKFLVGMAVLVGIKVFGKMLLGESLAGDFIRYFTMGIWVTVIAPYLFKAVLTTKRRE